MGNHKRDGLRPETLPTRLLLVKLDSELDDPGRQTGGDSTNINLTHEAFVCFNGEVQDIARERARLAYEPLQPLLRAARCTGAALGANGLVGAPDRLELMRPKRAEAHQSTRQRSHHGILTGQGVDGVRRSGRLTRFNRRVWPPL
jgi:hypothetical protein